LQRLPSNRQAAAATWQLLVLPFLLQGEQKTNGKRHVHAAIHPAHLDSTSQ
jgi:hypothetical protein